MYYLDLPLTSLWLNNKGLDALCPGHGMSVYTTKKALYSRYLKIEILYKALILSKKITGHGVSG
jgi:hypothetical protein